jgi:hypothetical protein
MSQVIASELLANGLRAEFNDTYQSVLNRQSDSRLSLVMDTITADNRRHEFGYFEAAPHLERWVRGESIPTGAFDSVSFEVYVYDFAKRVPWHKHDRADERTGSLYDMARMAGQSAALLEERFFFDVLTSSTDTLPTTPLAPDGGSLFSATNGDGGARFGATNGNLLTGTGIASTSTVIADYYSALEQFAAYQDGQGQPLFPHDIIGSDVLVIHASADTQIMEQSFLQLRQGLVYGSNTAAATPSNIIRDASRNVQLWASPRLATGDWYVFLTNAPKKPIFMLDRQGVQEYTSLESDNNGDHTRTTGEEYIQWERRAGAGVALPFGAIKINN